MSQDQTPPRPPSSRVGSSGPGWVPPSVEELQALLPQYEILSMLGHGGMGAVYKGKQISLDRLVAIKILPPGLDDDEVRFAERFKNEARTMARMNHPGIVSVYDFGETAEGQLYFVMEYVDGTDVAQMIKGNGKLPQDHALAVTAHVCDALAYAHGNGVIHRDIKPANILINMQGQVKVADFGLAKQSDASQTSGLTRTGMAMGTPDYVAPEALIMGLNVDGRADIYAMGVMLYQMLTGDIPRGMFLMPSIRNKGATDPRFDAIIARAMQTEREMRYQTAAELRRDLDVILTTPRVKQDASKVVAAIPEQAVKNAPGQRSAAQKPVMRGPGQPGGQAPKPQGRSANVPVREGTKGSADTPVRTSDNGGAAAKKNAAGRTPLLIGLGAVILVIIGILVFMFGGKKENAADLAKAPQEKSTPAAPSAPLTVVATPKSAPAAAPSEQWVDVLQEYFARPADQRQSAVIEPSPEGWKVVKSGVSFNIPLAAKPNVALRATVRGMKTLQMVVRSSGGDTTKNLRNYWATFTSDGSVKIVRSDQTQPTPSIELSHSAPVPGFSPDARHTFEFRAVDDVLTATVDGRVLASVRDGSNTKGGLSFAGSAGTIVEKLEMADLTDLKPAAAAPSTGTTGGEPWVDVLQEYFARPADQRRDSAVEPSADGWKVTERRSFYPSRGEKQDVALRATVRGIKDNLTLVVRATGGETAKNSRNYQALLEPDGSVVIVRKDQTQPNPTIELSRSAPVPGFSPAASHTFEFRAVSDVLTATLDGRMLEPVRDASNPKGGLAFVGNPGMIIEKLELADLTGQKPAAAAASSSLPVITGWEDLMAAAKVEIPRLGFVELKEENGWLVASKYKGMSGATLSEKHLKDTAMRGRVRGKVYVQFRTKTPPGYYAVRFLTDGTGVIDQWTSSKPSEFTTLATFTMAAAPEHDFLITMTGADLRVWVDGQLAATAQDTTIAARTVEIALAAEGAAFRDLAVAELPADFASKLASPAAAPSEQWVDALTAKGLAAPVQVGPAGVGCALSLEHRDLAIRATVSGVREGSTKLFLRASGPKEANRYSAGFGHDRKAAVALFRDGQETPKILAFAELPPAFDPAARHTAEFSAQGNTLILRIDGQEVARAEDNTLPSGTMTFYGGPEGSLLEKFEYRELPSASATPAVGGEQWVDAFAEWWADPKNQSSGRLVREAGGSRQVDPFGAGIARDFTDVALRVRAVGGSTAFYKLNLRSGNGGYQAELRREGKGLIRRNELKPDGKSLATTLASFDLPAGFSISGRHDLEFRVIKDVIELFVDGQKVATARDAVRTHGAISIEGKGALFEKFEYRDLSEKSAAPAPAAANSAADGPWTELIAPLLAKGQSSSLWKPAGTGVQVTKLQGWILDRKQYADVAVRVTARSEGDGSAWWVMLRSGSAAPNRPSRYLAKLERNGRGCIILQKESSKELKLTAFDLPTGFSIAENHTMEFRAQGDRLTVAVDGREMAVVHDSTHASGIFEIMGTPGTVFEKVEVRELASLSGGGGIPAAVAPSSGDKSVAAPTAPPDPKLATLLAQYTGAVAKAAAAAKAADRAAFDAELSRLKNNAPLPDAAEDAKLPEALKKLRGILRGQLQNLGGSHPTTPAPGGPPAK